MCRTVHVAHLGRAGRAPLKVKVAKLKVHQESFFLYFSSYNCASAGEVEKRELLVFASGQVATQQSPCRGFS
jgi:hypothetical protein